MAEELTIDVITDIVCPWCLVGVARLDKALAQVPEGTPVHVRHHPFLLDPDLGEEGIDLREKLTEKYGGDPAEMWARVEGEAEKSGIDLKIERQPHVWPTVKAHVLVRLAEGDRQHAVQKDLAAAYFHEAANLTDTEFLVGIADKHGLDGETIRQALDDPEQIAASHEHARAIAGQGITGVPFFVFNGRFSLSGCQPEGVFSQAVQAALQPEPHPA